MIINIIIIIIIIIILIIIIIILIILSSLAKTAFQMQGIETDYTKMDSILWFVKFICGLTSNYQWRRYFISHSL